MTNIQPVRKFDSSQLIEHFFSNRLPDIKALFKGVQAINSHSFMAFCPCHDNKRTQALSVKLTLDDKILVYCHAGCDSKDILSYIRSQGLSLSGYQPSPAKPREVNHLSRKKSLLKLFGKTPAL
jgi:rhodanese-related sulfurtransferase